MRTTLLFPHSLCLLLIGLLPALKGRSQTFALSSSSAMMALNGMAAPTSPAAPAPPPAPLNNYVTVAPFTTAVVSTPVNVTPNQINSPIFNPNMVGLNFAYHSPLVWWSGYTDYQQAAQGLNFNGGDAISIMIAVGAVNYILAAPYPQFQSYPTRQTTMIIRANDPTPVHFPLVQNGAVQINTYTPTVSAYSVSVPLTF